ncbi:MAG: sulfotransferase domain-containing protein, partial [Burkholderiaceae bacterium]
MMQGQQRALHFVEYDDLLDNPQDTMEKIYDFLEEDYFNHDF